ncbi:hypothetical protein MUK42_35331 [Musa troglodytarum]|uniref:Uncharacterized protein n=1 Tax=Musa troglodytarum TaxID=320322 RepID=A0A9E7KMW8_9LILI|nr:hypothetical protein MUK42_35331 [Musa troglodytarum]
MSDCSSREEGYYDGGFGELANPLQCPQLRKATLAHAVRRRRRCQGWIGPRPVQDWDTSAVEKLASAPPVKAVSPLIAPSTHTRPSREALLQREVTLVEEERFKKRITLSLCRSMSGI